MKKIFLTIGALALATSFAFAQISSGTTSSGTTGTQKSSTTNAGTPSSAYHYDSAFGASGGSGYGVGKSGGTQSGPIVGSPYGAAGAEVPQSTNRATLNTNAPQFTTPESRPSSQPLNSSPRPSRP